VRAAPRRHSMEKRHAFSADMAGLEAFHDEVQLMASNALEYNPEGSYEHGRALALKDFAAAEFQRRRREVQSAGYIARR
jgi:hypothetical protein